MELLVVFILYTVLGFGFCRILKRLGTRSSETVSSIYITLLIWPVFLVISAFNNELFDGN